jgi:sec-independent protein translocase protein TatA
VVGDILQPTHLLFILVVALIVLGPKRLPEVGRSLGRGLRDFRNALSGEESHEPAIPPASNQTPAHPAEAEVPAAPSEPADQPGTPAPPVGSSEPTPGPTESPASAPAPGGPDPDPQPVGSGRSQQQAS